MLGFEQNLFIEILMVNGLLIRWICRWNDYKEERALGGSTGNSGMKLKRIEVLK